MCYGQQFVQFIFEPLSAFLSSLNNVIWIDCNDKFGKVHFIKSKKIEDVTHNFSYVSLLN